MISSPYQYEALSRLQVSEGLLITAERWKHAQTYHRHRQNLYYQSLYQPGVVQGFGVQVMLPDPKQPNTFQLRISQGIAIDMAGNPVVLHCDCRLPIPAELDPMRSRGQAQTIYVVARYQDPETPDPVYPDYLDVEETQNHQSEPPSPLADTILERCQIAKRFELFPGDIELCRIQLEHNAAEIRPATSVYAPTLNCLDFGHREISQPRVQGHVRVSQLYSDPVLANSVALSFQQVLTATARLYPSLASESSVISVPHQDQRISNLESNDDDPHLHNNLLQGHLTYVPYKDLNDLSNLDVSRLKQQLNEGGIIFIAVDPNTDTLKKLQQRLSEGLTLLETPPVLEARDDDKTWKSEAEWKSEIEDYIDQIETDIEDTRKTIDQQIERFSRRLDYPLQGDGSIANDHPLRNFPFHFPSWPLREKDPLETRCWDGLVLVFADIQDIWGIETALGRFPKGEALLMHQRLRTTQEWGINLLHYAWDHHRLTQLQQGRCTRE